MNTDHKFILDENFVLCYQKFINPIVKFLHGFVPNWDICSDLSHDVFLKAYENIANLEPYSIRTRNFLFTVAKNLAIDYIKRSRKESWKYRRIVLEEVVLNDQFYKDVEEIFLEGEVVSTLHETINSFPEKERDLYVERKFEDRTVNEVADSYNVTPYKIRQIEEKISRKLRFDLEDLWYDD